MRIVVTGSSGLIGSHLTKRLIKDGHSVFGICRDPNKNIQEREKRAPLDLRDKEHAESVIKHIAPEIVFHLAANAAENKSVYSPIDITENGINTFYNTIVPAIKAGHLKRFVFTSSIAVYGSIHVPFREQDMPIPQDIYGINKLAVENSLRILSDVHGFEHVVIRPHNVYGPNQNMSDPYRNVVVLFMNQILKDKPYVIYGDGEMRRCFSYVEDVVDIIARSGFEDVAGMTFNVGSDKDYSINELSDKIREITETKIKPEYLPDRVHEVHTAIADHTLVKNVFGYNETSLEEGLVHTWNWALEKGPQKYKYSKIEIPADSLPKNWRT